jgi:formylglycine-generating enzyme required for sulfatase activity
MVLVQGGTFAMGCTSEQGSDCQSNEKPVHNVTLSSFYIGKYEVTQSEWEAVMGNNPSYFVGASLPVDQVSWDDVQEFITTLNTATGLNYRLPTEAEWEYAARGGAQSEGYKYSGSANIDDVAWYRDNSSSGTQPVGGKQANELGIYDMSGNVYERCSDWFAANYYAGGDMTNPVGPATGSSRLARGGCWSYTAQDCRVANRADVTLGGNFNILGFRLARSAE